jgi:hypothetical protein
VLKKAAQAARKLNEAVCSLGKSDRKALLKLATRHPQLREEPRIRPSTSPAMFEIDELNRTTWLLSLLFNVATGRTLPRLAGSARLSVAQGKKPGTVKNPAMENFIWLLLSCVDEFGGALPLDKNENFVPGGGALADALNILRKYLPRGVIPNNLALSTIQHIKTKRSKAQRLFSK